MRTEVGMDVEKEEQSFNASENCHSNYKHQYEGCSKKATNRTTTWSSYITLGI